VAKLTEYDVTLAVKLHKRGGSLLSIATRLGVSSGTIYARLRKRGVCTKRSGSAYAPRLAEPFRVCTVCERRKPSLEYRCIRRGALNGVCNSCSGNSALKAAKRARRKTKTCRACSKELPVNMFQKKRAVCKGCLREREKTPAARRKRAAYARHWRAANSRSLAVTRHRRRAIIYGTARHARLSVAEWHNILKRYGHRCAYCRRKARLEIDHVVPVSRGGRHTAKNVVPCCRSCNSSKSSRTPREWLRGAARPVPARLVPMLRDTGHIGPRRNAGRRHWRARLDDAKVRRIRALYASGRLTQSQLSARFGVHTSKISEIINRKRWAHVV
jgi:5-methylcytosine-specific restriction endonuclease McrA